MSAVGEYMRNASSPGRSGHRLARLADERVWAAREGLARLLGVDAPERVTFALNATMALNAAANHLGQIGGRILSSSFEHNSVTRPVRALERKGLIRYQLIPTAPDEAVDLGWLEAQLRVGDVSGVITTYASNVTGNVMPILEMSQLSREHGALFVVDAAQAVGHFPVDADCADVLVFAGHKGLGGPQSVGGAIIGEGVKLEPFVRGGSGGKSESIDQPRWLPWSQEAGTMNGPGIAGLAAATNELTQNRVASESQRVIALRAELQRGLVDLPGIAIIEHPSRIPRAGVLSFSTDQVSPSTLGSLLEEEFNVLVRTGLHCAPLAHSTMGTSDQGTIRVSIDTNNSESDISLLLEALSHLLSDSRTRNQKASV